MNLGVLVATAIVIFILGIVTGFVVAVIVKGSRDYKASGILHIKKTDEKDYYTIEVTDDLEEISSRKAIILTIDAREINIHSNEQ